MTRNLECGGLVYPEPRRAAAFTAEAKPKLCQNTKNALPRIFSSWNFYSRLFQFLLRDPLICSSLQQVQRQRSTIQHLVVKPTNIELASQFLPRALAQFAKFELAKF